MIKYNNEKNYDNMCMVYLSMQISKKFSLEKQFILIDEYYDKIVLIREDYRKYDNHNKSLLDSINDYINNNEKQIWETIKECIEK